MEKMEEKLFDYLEGKLTAADSARLESELRTNSELSKQLTSLRNTDRLMREYKVLEMSDDRFTDKIMERLERSSTRAKSSNRLLFMALGIFAAMFAAAFAVLPLFKETNVPPGTPSNYLPELPSFNFAALLEHIDNPALIQLVVIINAIALLLALDRLLSKKMKQNFNALM